MRWFLGIAVPSVALLLAFVSCERRARVIPVRKMEKIYREMFIADQWLEENPDKRTMADTTWFYEPIFEKYGFSSRDYQTSVEHYLNDPKRYAEMLGRVVDGLNAERNVLNKKLTLESRLRREADSLARARLAASVRPFPSFPEILGSSSMTDRICVELDSNWVYCPVPVVEDTVFLGPELIIRDTASAHVGDTLAKAHKIQDHVTFHRLSEEEIKLPDKTLRKLPIVK